MKTPRNPSSLRSLRGRPAGRPVLVIAGLLTTMLFGALSLSIASSAREALASRAWMAVQATVVSSRVELLHSPRVDSRIRNRALVEYTYAVQGSRTTSTRYTFSSTWHHSDGLKEQQRIVDEHPPGEVFTAFVDPNDPSQSVVVRDLPTTELVVAAGTAVLTMLGIGLVIFAFGKT